VLRAAELVHPAVRFAVYVEQLVRLVERDAVVG
jgi:hypothetical protein